MPTVGEFLEIMPFPEEHLYDARGEETKECIKFATKLKQLTIAGKLPCVWFHVSNENPSKVRHFYWSKIQKAMGLIKGAPDYAFAWEGGMGFIEMKSSAGRLSVQQKIFKEWSKSAKVPYEICFSADEAMECLKKWRVL